MAAISTQLKLNDGMSSVLRKINSALIMCLDGFESLQGASSNAIDVTQIRSMRADLVGVNQQLEKMCNGQESFNEDMDRGSSAADGLMSKLMKIAATYVSINSIKNLVTDSLSAADVQINAQVQLKTVMGNMDSLDYYDAVLEKAQDIQKKGIYGDEAMIAGAAELSTYFSDGEALLSMMDTLSDYAMGMSGGGEIDSKEMVDYATGIGKIMTGSYDAMTKKGFEFTDAQKAIIEGTATQAQIVETLGEQYIGASDEMLAAATIGAVIDESWAGLYETMSATPEAQMIQFKNTLGDIKETIGVGVYPAVLNFMSMFRENLPAIQKFADTFARGITAALNILTALVEKVFEFSQTMQNNWSWIEPLVWGIVAALGTYYAAMLAINTIEKISAGLKALSAARSAIKAGATLKEAAATKTATGAQAGLNAAILASPVTWIIAGVIALIAVIIAVVRALNICGAQSTSVIGTICGLIAVAGAFILNTVIGLLNGILQFLWTIFVEPFIGIIEWILNVCNGGFDSFGGAVANLIGQIISWFLSLGKVVTKIIDAIFGTNWTEGLTNLQNDVLAWGENENAITLDRNAPTIDYRMEYGDAFSAGAEFGDSISDKIGDMFSSDELTDFEALTQEAMGASEALDGIEENTGSTASALKATTEDLSYLRDIAEQEAVNRFTTAEVKIDMTGMTNRIDSNVDLDGVLTVFTEGFAQALEVAAEGVHV